MSAGILDNGEHFRPATIVVSLEADFIDIFKNKIETDTF